MYIYQKKDHNVKYENDSPSAPKGCSIEIFKEDANSEGHCGGLVLRRQHGLCE